MVSPNQSLSTSTTQPGTIWYSARLLAPVMKDNSYRHPRRLHHHWTRSASVSEGRRITGGASIRLRPDEVVLPDGTRYFLHAEVYDLGDTRHVKTGSEGDCGQCCRSWQTHAGGSQSARRRCLPRLELYASQAGPAGN